MLTADERRKNMLSVDLTDVPQMPEKLVKAFAEGKALTKAQERAANKILADITAKMREQKAQQEEGNKVRNGGYNRPELIPEIVVDRSRCGFGVEGREG